MSNFPLFRQVVRVNSLGFIDPENQDHANRMETRARFLGESIGRHFTGENLISFWSIQSLVSQMLGDFDFQSRMMEGVWSIPLRMPFPAIWFEFSLGDKDMGCLALEMDVDQHPGKVAVELHPMMVSRSHKVVTVLPCVGNLGTDEEGNVAAFVFLDDMRRQLTIDNESGNFDKSASTVIVASLVAIGMAGCKNVELVERLPKRHEQREAKRRGEPILKYHEIVIDPGRTTQVAVGAGNPHQDKPSRALHIARGHFATYTEDKPLFGKYTGTYWRPAHVRGSAELGAIKSTYKVKGAAA